MEDNQTNVNEFTHQTNTTKISKCRYCNSLIKDTQSVCSQCGAPLYPEDFK